MRFNHLPPNSHEDEREKETIQESYVKEFKKARQKHEDLARDLKYLISRDMPSWSYELHFVNEGEGDFTLRAEIDKKYEVLDFCKDPEFIDHVQNALNKCMPLILSEVVKSSQESLNNLAKEARREAEDIMSKVKELEEKERGDQTLVT